MSQPHRASAPVTGSGVLVLLVLAATAPASAQIDTVYTRADSLRGALDAPARTWWDVTFYDLEVAIHPADSTIQGRNVITYRVVEEVDTGGEGAPEMQIDLQAPLAIDSVIQDGRALPLRREGNAWFARSGAPQPVGSSGSVTVHYGGRPHIARRPPWDGGFTFTTDSLSRPWIVTTSQGIGASVWWPNKDIGAEEPDSQRVAVTVPDPMIHVGNGRLRDVVHHADGTTTWEWFVSNPINNYAISVAAGSYAHWSETWEGENGELTLDFWPLDYHLEAAKEQWTQARSTLECFEHWFGPYPFYEDGYKLVEVPHNGMEHQSAVAYGNGYADGYRGGDASGTGLGLEWDFIIVHESAHEWFANNITAKDLADMWVHESFANYAEGLYTECLFGKEAGARYMRGVRSGIRNDRPIVPAYGVNAQGSGDMYPKGGNMLHTIRQIVDDDERWRAILRGLNETFRHETVMGAEVEAYLGEEAGIDLDPVFGQYLRTTMIPVLEYRLEGTSLAYRWANVVPGFDMPVEVALGGDGTTRLRPGEEWRTVEVTLEDPADFAVDPDYYVEVREVASPPAPSPSSSSFSGRNRTNSPSTRTPMAIQMSQPVSK